MPTSGLGFPPSRPLDKDLGTIIHLRGGLGGMVRGRAVREAGEESQCERGG